MIIEMWQEDSKEVRGTYYSTLGVHEITVASKMKLHFDLEGFFLQTFGISLQ